jgi:hypothetical protein
MKRALLYCCIGFVWSCNSSSDPEPAIPICDNPPSVLLVSKTSPSDCSISDGVLVVKGEGGSGAFEFSIDGLNFQNSGTFENLTSSVYEVTVKDLNACTNVLNVEILNPNSTVSITNIEIIDSGCKESNGAITINAVGIGTLSFVLDGGTAQSNNAFTGLGKGSYIVVVSDDNGCELTRNVNLMTGISFNNQIKNIIGTNCAITGCHNGDIGSSRDWTVFSNVQSNASNIKSRTQSGNMPPANSGKSLTPQQKDLIACWVDDGAINN